MWHALVAYTSLPFLQFLPRDLITANRIPWVNPGDNLQNIFSLPNDQIQFRHRFSKFHEAKRHNTAPASKSEQPLN